MLQKSYAVANSIPFSSHSPPGIGLRRRLIAIGKREFGKVATRLKKRSESNGSDPSSCVFYHFTRKLEDSERQYTWDNLIKIGLLSSNLSRLV